MDRHIIASAITLKMLLGEKKVDDDLLHEIARELHDRGFKSEAECLRVVAGAMIVIEDFGEEE